MCPESLLPHVGEGSRGKVRELQQELGTAHGPATSHPILLNSDSPTDLCNWEGNMMHSDALTSCWQRAMIKTQDRLQE